jgi:magnesium transporter
MKEHCAVIVDCAVYRDGARESGRPTLGAACDAARRDGSFAWIGLYEPTHEEFDSVASEFDLHELAVEDAIHAHQRPKLEVYGHSLFIVLRTARYIDAEERVEFGEILVFIGSDFIITVRHGEASALADVRRKIESRPELLRSGPGAVLHAVVDQVVDDYAPVLDGLENDIEEVETQVFSETRDNPAERIYFLKREVLAMRRAILPLVGPLETSATTSHELIADEIRAYFRDVHDHALRQAERVVNANELLTGILEANLAQVTSRQNHDMRRISAIVAIVAVPTMIAGIYGMNFEFMPELHWRFGYPLAVVVMLVICGALYQRFRRAGWL